MDFGAAWAIVLLPVLGFLVLALFGRRMSKQAVNLVAIVPLLLSFAVSVLLTLHLSSLSGAARDIPPIIGPDWINILSLRVPFELIVDPLSLTMALIVTGVGSLIFIYSVGYMSEDKDYARFYTYMSLFAASMLTLVMGNNLVLLFMGWEGVGLCSYLLIGFWYKDLANARAANKAFIVNRIGDWGFSLGIFLLFAVLIAAKTPIQNDRIFSYDVMLPAIQDALSKSPGIANTIALLFFVGAAGKSAQFPLYFWLPDAMAGPTPVSALIHAATMVTSGVVLLNRVHVVFELAPMASAVVCGIGAFTAIFAALIAFGQADIKKVLAFSTVSQLGYMFIGCGAGAYWAGMFHVTTHAFFKALLFLGAGAVIHAMAHNQDMRNYGGIAKYMKVTTACMWIATLAIAGLWPFAGYFSKEAILHAAFSPATAADSALNAGVTSQAAQMGQLAGWIGLLTALLTAWYMTRLMMLTFHGPKERWREIVPAHAEPAEGSVHSAPEPVKKARGKKVAVALEQPAAAEAPVEDPNDFFYAEPLPEEHEEHHALGPDHTPKEVPATMLLPLAILAVLSVGGGFFLAQGDAFQKWLTPSSGLSILHPAAEAAEKVPVTQIAIAAAILGILVGVANYFRGLPASEGWDLAKWNPLRKDAAQQFGFDRFATGLGVEGGRDLALGTWKGVETWVVDGAVRGTAWIAEALGIVFAKLQTGYVRFYALVFVTGVLCVLGYIAFAANQGGVQ